MKVQVQHPADSVRHVVDGLLAAIQGEERDVGAWIDQTDRERTQVLARTRGHPQWAEIRFLESVVLWQSGRAQLALSAVRDVLGQLEGRGPLAAQALVSCHLAACCRLRGDLRASVLAARRAEALLAAAGGDVTEAMLAVRSWLLRAMARQGAGTGGVQQRLTRTWTGLCHLAVDAPAMARLDGLHALLVDNEDPPHWTILHLRNWRKEAASPAAQPEDLSVR